MIIKVQEENLKILLTALVEADVGRIAMKWLGKLSQRSGRCRRQSRELYKLSKEDAAEIYMSGQLSTKKLGNSSN